MASALTQKIKSIISDRQTQGFLISVVIMAAISFLFFLPDNIEGNDLRQHDMVQGLANGHEIAQYQALTGEKSWWTNSLFSGMPSFQISPSYASNSMFSWITKVYGLGLPAPSNLLFMMMVGFMILMMAMKVRWEYGLIGAVAWGLSTYFVIIIGAGHIWKFVTLSYIPPTIAGIVLAYRGRLIGGGALAALFTMMQLSANHVQMTYYFAFVILAIMVAYLVDSIRRKQVAGWGKATAVVIVAGALGIGANLPNIYHTQKYAKETQRQISELADSDESASQLDWITQYSYGRTETLTLLIPDIKGGATMKASRQKSMAGQSPIVSLGDLPQASSERGDIRGFLKQIPQYFGEPEATNGPVYVGVIIFALFLIGCVIVKGPLKWALLAVTVVTVLLAWGRNFMPLTEFFVNYVPLYSKFRTPESILVVAEFTMPLLAMLALAQILTGDDRRRYLRPTLWCTGIVAVLCVIGWLAPGFYGSDDDLSRQILDMSRQEPAYREAYAAVISLRQAMVSADSIRSLLFLLAMAAPLVLWQMGKLRQAMIVVGVTGVAVVADLYMVDKRYVDHDSFVVRSADNRYRAGSADIIQPTAADKIIMADTAMHYRVMEVDLGRFSSAEPSYFHKMLGGYHAAKLGRYQDMIDRHLSRMDSPADFDVASMLNAKYFVAQGRVIPNPDAMGNAWFVDKIEYVDSPADEMDALDLIDLRHTAVADARFRDMLGDPTPADPADTIYLTSYLPDRLTYNVSTANGATAVFSEVYFPWGWHAQIDGKPVDIGRVNYLLRAINVPAGDHQLVMTFDPASITVTTTIAFIAAALIYLWVIAAIAIGLRKIKN